MPTVSKYRLIAQLFISSIESGQLRLGSKLPSLRMTMRQHQISMTTALACYRYLEQQGYATAEQKKGFYIDKPNKYNETMVFPHFIPQVAVPRARQQSRQHTTMADTFATASLDTKLIDHHFLKQSLQSVIKHTGFDLSYESPQGSIALRQQLAQHFNQQGFSSHPDDLVITNGCLDAIAMALELTCQSGELVAVSSPCYMGLLNMLSFLGLTVIEIPTTEQGIDLQSLIEAIESKPIKACILTANHQNPTGHNISLEQKQQLALLADKYQLPIIEDDVFRELNHRDQTPLPIKHFDHQGWVFWCGSFSKTLAPGLRLGWCKPGRFLPQYIEQRKIKTLGVNRLTQQAMADYLSRGHYSRHLKKTNKTLRQHCQAYVAYLLEHLPVNSEVLMPDGGLVLWVRVPQLNSQLLTQQLAEKNIFIKYGNEFSTTTLYSDCFRLNLGLTPTEAAYQQLDTMCTLIKQHPY
jgi:DNA-binding transcriptional MocR family regulator